MKHTPEDLLWTIQGTFGENMATAYLKWLLGCEGMATPFLTALFRAETVVGTAGETLADQLPEADTLIEEVQLEVDTVSGGMRGRLDMLIETKKWVIGLESKFHAPFQDGQPEKYLDAIKQRAGNNRRSMLVVLAPSYRWTAIKQELGRKKVGLTVRLLDWESLIKSLIPAEEHARWKVELLQGYFARHCDPLEQVRLQRQQPNDGTSDVGQQSILGESEVQAQFLRALVALGEAVPGLPAGRLIANAKSYLVYEFDFFRNSDEDRGVALFGFVDRTTYGLEHIQSTRFDRAFVLCSPVNIERQGATAPAELELAERKHSRFKGIIRHAQEGEEAWVVPDQLLLDAVETKDREDRLMNWLSWVYLGVRNPEVNPVLQLGKGLHNAC